MTEELYYGSKSGVFICKGTLKECKETVKMLSKLNRGIYEVNKMDEDNELIYRYVDGQSMTFGLE